MNEQTGALSELTQLGLNRQEVKVYTSLLRQPSTYASLSALTGINRTTLYRIVDKLRERGFISIRTDDVGKMLVASSPENLEILVSAAQDLAVKRQTAYTNALPQLLALQSPQVRPAIYTYEGVEGIKQMLWHELSAEGEILMLIDGTLESMTGSRRWSESYRQRAVERQLQIRVLWNNEVTNFTQAVDPDQYSRRRVISSKILPIHNQMTVYDDTVSFYYWTYGNKFGVEISNAQYADMWRGIFDQYWNMADPAKAPASPVANRS